MLQEVEIRDMSGVKKMGVSLSGPRNGVILGQWMKERETPVGRWVGVPCWGESVQRVKEVKVAKLN